MWPKFVFTIAPNFRNTEIYVTSLRLPKIVYDAHFTVLIAFLPLLAGKPADFVGFNAFLKLPGRIQ